MKRTLSSIGNRLQDILNLGQGQDDSMRLAREGKEAINNVSRAIDSYSHQPLQLGF